MAIPAKLVALNTAMANYKTAVVTAINQKVSLAYSALNALKLGTKTNANFQSDATAALNAHQAATNPHNVSAASLNTYTSAQITAKFGTKVLQGILPMSMFKIDTNMLLRKTTQWEIYTVNMKAMLSGRSWKKNGGYWHPLSLQIVNGTTYYIYLLMNGGIITLDVTTDPLTESETVYYIGFFVGPNTTSNTSLTAFGVGNGQVRIDNFRPKTTALGGGIPVSGSDTTIAPALIWK